jgi:hypothetical protein
MQLIFKTYKQIANAQCAKNITKLEVVFYQRTEYWEKNNTSRESAAQIPFAVCKGMWMKLFMEH